MAKPRKIRRPYDPLNLDDMLAKTQDGRDPEFTMDWHTVIANAEDQSDEDGHGNPMPKSGLKRGAKLPRFLKKP
jgi:hypothetical protein